MSSQSPDNHNSWPITDIFNGRHLDMSTEVQLTKVTMAAFHFTSPVSGPAAVYTGTLTWLTGSLKRTTALIKLAAACLPLAWKWPEMWLLLRAMCRSDIQYRFGFNIAQNPWIRYLIGENVLLFHCVHFQLFQESCLVTAHVTFSVMLPHNKSIKWLNKWGFYCEEVSKWIMLITEWTEPKVLLVKKVSQKKKKKTASCCCVCTASFREVEYQFYSSYVSSIALLCETEGKAVSDR